MRRVLPFLTAAALHASIFSVPVFAQTTQVPGQDTTGASVVEATPPQGRFLERRVYTIYPANYREQLDLAMKFEALARRAGKDLRVLIPNHYGPKSVFMFEVEFDDEAEQKAFWDAIYPTAAEEGWITQWFKNVQHWERELWTVY